MNLLLIWGEKWDEINYKSIIAVSLWATCFYPSELVILSEDPDITSIYPDSVYMPRESGCLCEALCDTYHLWPERTIILSPSGHCNSADLKSIVRDRRPVSFWADSNIQAISVYQSEAKQLMLSMWQATSDWYSRKGTGGLWEAYRIYCGLDPDYESTEDYYLSRLVYEAHEA